MPRTSCHATGQAAGLAAASRPSTVHLAIRHRSCDPVDTVHLRVQNAMGFNMAKWFIEGEVDWDYWNEQLAQWGPVVAGALFGAGWCCWADALVFQKAIVGVDYPFKYNWPGIVATIAMVMINLLPRRDLVEEGREEGEEFRARLWLFMSFLIAAGAVAGSVAVLVSTSQQQDMVSVGVGSVLQCGLILGSSILFWAFRSGESDSYGYISTH